MFVKRIFGDDTYTLPHMSYLGIMSYLIIELPSPKVVVVATDPSQIYLFTAVVREQS